MEQEETAVAVTTRSAGIRFGLIAAVVSIFYFVILNVVGINMTSGPWQYVGWILTVAFIFLAHKYYKDNGDGYMSYGQGIGIAFWLGLISGVISSIFTYIYIKFVDQGFIEMIKDKQLEDMQAKGMSEDQIEQAMKISSMFMTPEAMLIFGLIGAVVGALIIGLIVTIFTQKKSPETTF
jgi:hypothetical protein